jgi:glycosyltransferase involved in cell wall biosynthesis
MHTNSLVSIYIVTYNREYLLSRCVKSILRQKFQDFEILIVNNGELLSNDINDLSQKIKVINANDNLKYAKACNLAHKNSCGRYIALLGDDDYWIDENKLSKQLKYLDKNPDVGVVGTSWEEDSGSGNVNKLIAPGLLSYKNRNDRSRVLKRGSAVCGSTPLIRREAWDVVGGMDSSMPRGIDSDFFRSIFLSNWNLANIDDVTTLVDVDNNRPRMTPVNSLASIDSAIFSSLRTIKKNFREYCYHPDALFYRLFQVFKLFVKRCLMCFSR